MKNLFYILIGTLLVFASCKKDEEAKPQTVSTDGYYFAYMEIPHSGPFVGDTFYHDSTAIIKNYERITNNIYVGHVRNSIQDTLTFQCYSTSDFVIVESEFVTPPFFMKINTTPQGTTSTYITYYMIKSNLNFDYLPCN